MKKVEPIIKGRGEVRGLTFTRIKETENVYVYEQRFDETGEVLGYEVFEKKYSVSYPITKSIRQKKLRRKRRSA